MVLPAPAFAPASSCSRTSYHMIFSEGDFEEVAGQEEGSVKRVRQVMLHNRIAIRLPLHFISFDFYATRLTLTLFFAMQGFGLFTHVSGNVYAATPSLNPTRA